MRNWCERSARLLLNLIVRQRTALEKTDKAAKRRAEKARCGRSQRGTGSEDSGTDDAAETRTKVAVG